MSRKKQSVKKVADIQQQKQSYYSSQKNGWLLGSLVVIIVTFIVFIPTIGYDKVN